MTPVEQYLRALIARCDGPVPLVDELVEADLGTARATAAIARAAWCWYLEGRPDAIRARLTSELAEADGLAVLRVRSAWCEFESSWREFRCGREHLVSHAELARRRGGVL